jgi:acyl-CoA thioesterase
MPSLPDMSEVQATAAPALTPVSDLLAARQREGRTVRFTVSPDWLQGRTTFGGLLSALAVQAMRDVCGEDWPLRALQTNFVGPVGPGSFDVEVTLLRQGKNVRQAQATITQPGPDGQPQVGGVLLGVFGSGRESALPVLRPVLPSVSVSPEKAFVWPYLEGLTPAFTRHIEARHAEGVTPFTGAADWFSRTFVKLRQTTGVDTELTAVLLADAGPTPALGALKSPAFASSVSWALELRPVDGDHSEGLWRMDKTALATGEGYVNEKTELWTPDGQLAALGYQVVAVYG